MTPNETSVAENIPINTVIMAIKAVDRDEGRNGYVEYQLDPAVQSPFTVGSADGLLRVSGRLDRETKSSYELTVTAKDRGEPPKSSQSKIRIHVLDENDNSPIFDPKQYSAAIAENASIGASVLQVSPRYHADPRRELISRRTSKDHLKFFDPKTIFYLFQRSIDSSP